MSGRAVVVGVLPRRNEADSLRAVLIAVPAGRSFRYVGRVESGLDSTTVDLLRTRLRHSTRKTPPLSGPVPRGGMQGVVWTTPRVICEVEYSGLVPVVGYWSRPRLLRVNTSLSLSDLRGSTVDVMSTVGDPVSEGPGGQTVDRAAMGGPPGLGDQLVECLERLTRTVHEGLTAEGLSLTRLRALEVLVEHGPMRQSDLSRQRALAPRTVTALVNLLERDGLVERRNDPTNRTAILVQVTDAGRRARVLGRAARADAWDHALAELSDAEQAFLRRVVVRVAAGPTSPGVSGDGFTDDGSASERTMCADPLGISR